MTIEAMQVQCVVASSKRHSFLAATFSAGFTVLPVNAFPKKYHMSVRSRFPPKIFTFRSPRTHQLTHSPIQQGNPMTKSVFCIATSEPDAQAITNELSENGFAREDISVLFPDRSGSRDFAHEQNTKAPEGTVAGVSTGGVLGGALGWVVGIGALAIPGVGPFIAAGPIVAMLAGSAVGATVGGITGALIGMGIPEIEAKQYEGKIKAGNILISVHAENDIEIEMAKRIFGKANAEDITSTGESVVPDDDGDAPEKNISQQNSNREERFNTTLTGLAPVAGVEPIATNAPRHDGGAYKS